MVHEECVTCEIGNCINTENTFFVPSVLSVSKP
jgi:hypothetical protein